MRLSVLWSSAWRIAIVALTLVWLPGLSAAACTSHPSPARHRELSPRALARYEWAREHLDAPFHGYDMTDDLDVHAFDVVLLSNLASGLMNVGVLDPTRRGELRLLAEETARRALSAEVSPIGAPVDPAQLGDHNLYASHVLLILGIEHHLGSDVHDPLASRLAGHLRARSLGRTFHARSFPGSARWPADQAVTLAALRLHDHEHATDLAGEPIRGWLAWLDRHRTGELPWSATGGLSYARTPRGCALSWMATYMAQFAPSEGARLYDAYREQHAIAVLGWHGFREWPRGRGGGSDIDAGPVLFGWGTSATGLGLGASRLYGDGAAHAGIERTADTVGLPTPLGGRHLLAPTLGQAMLFSGATATRWWDERPERSAPTRSETDWPAGPFALFALVLALDTWLVRGIVRARQPRRAA